MGMQIYEVAVTPDGKRVYVTSREDTTVSEIYTATNNVTATVNVGQGTIGDFISTSGRFNRPNVNNSYNYLE
jgi:YVTN family beta-propeller protein